MSQTFSVTGLNCQSCVHHVTGALSALDGVHTVSVDLDPKGASTIHVEASRALSGDEVQAALAEEGDYSLLR
ncbi:MAG: copper chaperone [Actinomycetota bacterium]|jgi:copper chaperone CopZ|nr:copper chaperone [Actinomycetota bacterium]HPY23918.1 heavy metal-associated domain-containing protein [Mycobacterium sp.]